MAQNMP
jgi:hypothetical protein